jgi:hypothetical protein
MGFLAGCGDGQEQAQSQGGVTAEDVKEEAVETIETAQAYTRQQKEEYQTKIAEQLKALDSKMDGLEAEAETLQGDVRTQYERMLVTLKQKRREADEIYTELNQKTGEAWSAVKIRMDNMMRNLKAAFGQVASHPS